jgi:hypothetical protein
VLKASSKLELAHRKQAVALLDFENAIPCPKCNQGFSSNSAHEKHIKTRQEAQSPHSSLQWQLA